MAESRAEYEFNLEDYMKDGVGIISLDEFLTAISKAINAEKSKVAYTLSSADKVRIADNTKARMYKEYPMLKREWLDAIVEEQMMKYEDGKYTERLTEVNLLSRSIRQVAEVLIERYFLDYFD